MLLGGWGGQDGLLCPLGKVADRMAGPPAGGREPHPGPRPSAPSRSGGALQSSCTLLS